MQRPNIHILGIQGSGKGTQSKLLVDRLNLTLLASGNLFRRRALESDKFAQHLSALLKTGDLLPDEDLLHIVQDFLAHQPIQVGLLGDGVIRTTTQYELLSPIWRANELAEPFLIHLKLDDETALNRIASRGIQDDIPREDTTPEAINRRIELFHTRTEPVLERFAEGGRLVTVDATQDISTVFSTLCDALAQHFPNLIPDSL